MTEKVIDRTSKGLIDILFDELASLVNGDSTPQHARAVSSVASTLCSVSRLEMDYSRFVSQPRTNAGEGGLTRLMMGSAA